MNQTKIIASIILALNELGVKLDSPYALEEVGEILAKHSLTSQFFYRDEEPIDPIRFAQDYLHRLQR